MQQVRNKQVNQTRPTVGGLSLPPGEHVLTKVKPGSIKGSTLGIMGNVKGKYAAFSRMRKKQRFHWKYGQKPKRMSEKEFQRAAEQRHIKDRNLLKLRLSLRWPLRKC